MILLRDLRLELSEQEPDLRRLAARQIRCAPEDILQLQLLKKSLDARRKSDLHWRCSLALALPPCRGAADENTPPGDLEGCAG